MRHVPLGAALAILVSFAAYPAAGQAPPANGAGTDEAVRGEERRNEEVIRHNCDSLNRGDLKAYVLDYAEDMKNFNEPVGREGIRTRIEDIVATFPDYRKEIVDLIARGDTVVVRCRVSGTHRGVGKLALNGGMLVGVPPTGKHFEVQHIHWYRLRDGKIVEHTAARDDLGMMRQLGLLPQVGSPR